MECSIEFKDPIHITIQRTTQVWNILDFTDPTPPKERLRFGIFKTLLILHLRKNNSGLECSIEFTDPIHITIQRTPQVWNIQDFTDPTSPQDATQVWNILDFPDPLQVTTQGSAWLLIFAPSKMEVKICVRFQHV